MESLMLSNVSKVTFKLNVIHRFQGVRAQSILDQLRLLIRQMSTPSLGTPIPEPYSNLVTFETFSPLGKTTR